MTKYFILLITVFGLLFSISAQEKYVIMVSLDGFRWDYCSKTKTPVFDSIEKYGVKAESMEPAFPTKTFPNHYTLVTGLYPDHHGIVNNSFFSPEHEATYSIGDREKVEDGTYYLGKPIWNLAEEHNIITATYFWIGSEADINEKHPTYWKQYQHNFPFKQRIDTVVSWLKLPENKRPHLMLLYFHEPDSKGHKYGPDSKEIEDLAAELDQLMDYLFENLNKLDIKEKINVIITSDHGMATVSEEKTLFLQDYLKEYWIERIGGANPVFNIWAKENFKDSVKIALSKMQHIEFWDNSQPHKYYHYGNNPRTGNFTVVADSSWSIQYKSKYYSKSKGAHGYDNRNKDMHAIFYAIGPDFKSNYNTGILKNIDIYPLLTYIFGLEVPEIDGKFEKIKHVLKK